jgi:hypothetical protein
MTEYEKEHAENTEQQECVKNFGRFCRAVISHFPIGFIPVIERQQRLDNTCHPEKSYQTSNEHEHFPLTNLCTCQMSEMAFCKNYAYNEEDNRLHQLEKLQPRNVVY